MGMSIPVVDAVVEVLKEIGPGAKVLSLGYPDILKPLKDIPLDGLEEHTDSSSISGYHGRDISVPTAESFFAALGATLTVIDTKAWRGPEVTFDLNKSSGEPGNPFIKGEYDLIIDPGTSEHCFNIGCAMRNILGFVKVGGYVVHWNPFIMPNHGFYNLNPTFFWDWYLTNGGTIKHSSIWVMQEDGTETQVIPPSTDRFNLKNENASILTIARKIEETDVTWPVQTKYKNLEKMGA
jgi:hypothetical protein